MFESYRHGSTYFILQYFLNSSWETQIFMYMWLCRQHRDHNLNLDLDLESPAVWPYLSERQGNAHVCNGMLREESEEEGNWKEAKRE